MAPLYFFSKKNRPQKTIKPSRGAPVFTSPHPVGPHCPNVNCITVNEPGSTRLSFEVLSDGPAGALILRCLYCDQRFKVGLVGQTSSKKYCAYDMALADTFKNW